MAEKMLTNWFTFLLYKFLKVGLRGLMSGGKGWGGEEAKKAQRLGPRAQRSNPDYLLLAVSCVDTCCYRESIDIHALKSVPKLEFRYKLGSLLGTWSWLPASEGGYI